MRVTKWRITTANNRTTTCCLATKQKKINQGTNISTSVFRHSGHCLHDADKIVFIVTEFSKHIKQATSHDLPTEQESIKIVDRLLIPHIVTHTRAILKHNSCQMKLYRAEQTTFFLLNISTVEKHSRGILQLTWWRGLTGNKVYYGTSNIL